MPGNLGLPTPSGGKSKTKYIPPDNSKTNEHRQHGSSSRIRSGSGDARASDSRVIVPRNGGGAPNEAEMSLARPAPNMGRGEVGRIGPDGRGGRSRSIDNGGGLPAIMGVRPLPVGVLVPPPFEERGGGFPMGGPMMGRRDNSDTARQLAELSRRRHERELRDIQEDMDEEEDYEQWQRLEQQRRQQQQQQYFVERPPPDFYHRGTPGNVPVMPVMGVVPVAPVGGVVPVAPVPGMVRRPLPYGAGSRPMNPRFMYDSD